MHPHPFSAHRHSIILEKVFHSEGSELQYLKAFSTVLKKIRMRLSANYHCFLSTESGVKILLSNSLSKIKIRRHILDT